MRASGRPLLAVALLLFASAAAAQTQRDILFIAIDDLNDWVGVLGGHPQTKTPNIDALAARGLVFTNAHTPAPLCNAARTAILTGLRPSTSGIYRNSPDWRTVARFDGLPTLPRFFRDHGYRTLGAGKIFHAHTFGVTGLTGYNDLSAWDGFFPSPERQLPDELQPLVKPANDNPGYIGFDWAPLVATDSAMGDGQTTEWIARQLVAETGSPRFVAAGIYRPHLPWYVPQKYFDMHPLDEIELPPSLASDYDDIPAAMQDDGFMNARTIHDWVLETDKWRAAVQGYLASISFADAMVGRLLDALEQSGRADDTIIVLWGDHGFHLGEKLRWRKSTLWEEATRVPFIIVAPGVTEPGSSSSRPVSTFDLYPTLAELAGLPVPDHVEGRSLVPLLADPSHDWPYPALTTYNFDNHSLRTERYRYTRYADGSEELYDHATDPNEWTNLAGDPAYAGLIESLVEWLPAENAPDLFQPGPRP